MFNLDESQQKKLEAWIEAKPSKDAYEGAIGGRYTYCFTPTSLGVVVRVQDAIDKDEINLTDYENW